MLKKILPILFVTFFVSACEAPMDETNTNNDNGAVTDNSVNNGYTGDGIGSEHQGRDGGELAPGVPDTIRFAVDSSAIEGEAQTILSKHAGFIKQSGTTVLVEGHCDERGTREYNLALGERRANAIKQYLVSQGVDGSKVDTISYGKERPVAEGSDESSWARNRRGITVKR